MHAGRHQCTGSVSRDGAAIIGAVPLCIVRAGQRNEPGRVSRDARAAGGSLRVIGTALLCAFLSTSCAATLTVAIGKDARAAIAQPSCPGVALALGTRTIESAKYDDKIGFAPQVETTTTTTEPATPPALPPAHEAVGSDVGDGIAGVFRGLGQFFRALVPW